MKKVTDAHLNGIFFHFEDDAYHLLERYLNAIKNQYKKTKGCDEIITDIESRLAEMFSNILKNQSRNVVVLTDVREVIQKMGRPEDFEESHSTDDAASKFQRKYRKLYRDPDDNWLGGVCSGIAAYLGIQDPLIVRIILIVLLIISLGTTAIVYLILWIVIPKAKTTAEKLEMRGETVNISNIGKKIEEEWQQFKNRVSAF